MGKVARSSEMDRPSRVRHLQTQSAAERVRRGRRGGEVGQRPRERSCEKKMRKCVRQRVVARRSEKRIEYQEGMGSWQELVCIGEFSFMHGVDIIWTPS